jgi:hypothetical protein
MAADSEFEPQVGDAIVYFAPPRAAEKTVPAAKSAQA